MLPIFQTENKDLMLMETKWKSILDPVLAKPLIDGNILKAVSLVSGTNVINHGLGRRLQGWFLVRQRKYSSAYNVFDIQDINQMPQLTLYLNCDQGTTTSPVVVDIYVF